MIASPATPHRTSLRRIAMLLGGLFLLACSVVKAEDRTFFEHQGFIWERVSEAAQAMFAGVRSSGGSTITQQLARNLFLSPERSLWRKLREAFIADRLERELGKRQILEVYLNSIATGQGAPMNPAALRRFAPCPCP